MTLKVFFHLNYSMICDPGLRTSFYAICARSRFSLTLKQLSIFFISMRHINLVGLSVQLILEWLSLGWCPSTLPVYAHRGISRGTPSAPS